MGFNLHMTDQVDRPAEDNPAAVLLEADSLGEHHPEADILLDLLGNRRLPVLLRVLTLTVEHQYR